MAYRIEEIDGYFEVHVWGATSKAELVGIVGELARRDGGLRRPDIWLLARESLVPFQDCPDIAEAVRELVPPGMTGGKTAIVAGDEFQRAQFELYRSEASMLPFEIRVFRSRSDAVEWVKT